jgi:hypothetical protein
VLAALIAAPTACSSGGAGKTDGAAGSGSAGASAGTTGGAGTSGAAGTTGGAGTTGKAGTSGGAGAGAGTTGSAGTGSDAGTSDASGDAAGGGADAHDAGRTSCAGRAISMSANTTGSTKDVAHARVTIDLMADTPLGNVPRTIEFWFYVKPTDWVAEVNEIFVMGSTPATLQQLGLDFGMPAVKGMPNNHATLGPYTDGVFDDDTGVYLGIDSAAAQWIHVAMTWDMTALRTFVNGVERITTKAPAGQVLKTTAGPLVLGCNPPYFGCFAGMFDELRVWNVARTPEEIMAHYDKALVGNEPGLTGYWKFDDAPGSATAADSVTAAGHTAHPGVLAAVTDAGAPTFVTPDPPPPVSCP